MHRANPWIVLVSICLLGAAAPCGGEAVFLRDPDQREKKREGILLYISANGRLFTDSGPATEKSLLNTFKEWRAGGTEPGVRLVLFPSLKSNSDLKVVRRIIDFLRANKIGCEVMLEAADAVPDEDLQ